MSNTQLDNFKCLGYNMLDNYLYAIHEDSSTETIRIVRINSQGVVTNIGQIPHSVEMGDVDSEGFYWVAGSYRWSKIDVRPNSNTYGQVLANNVIDNLQHTIRDWTSLPQSNGGYLWAVATSPSSHTNNNLLRFSKEFGTWEVVRTYTDIGTYNWGPQYAFGSQNAILAVDYSGGTTLKFYTQSNLVSWIFPDSYYTTLDKSDGASCLAGHPDYAEAG